MPIHQNPFGKLSDGSLVDLFTLTNRHGSVAKVTNYGAILTELHMPDKTGARGNVVLGFASLEPYLKDHPYFGATIGRYANRIAKGTFSLNAKTYRVPTNNGANALHGGPKGFDKRLWTATTTADSLTLVLHSTDGDQGFPGNLTATATYMLTDDDALSLTFQAVTDAPTVVNMCNHSYFNLNHAAGGEAGTIFDHVVQIEADDYTPVDVALIPTGQIEPVAGTALDFTEPTPIGARAAQVSGGYDHNFVLRAPTKAAGLNAASKEPVLAARVTHPSTGRVMEVWTTQPGIQLYAGNFLDGTLTGVGGTYQKNSGFCLETQHFPDSPNQRGFPSTVLMPGQKYFHRAIYKFSVG